MNQQENRHKKKKPTSQRDYNKMTHVFYQIDLWLKKKGQPNISII